MTIKRFITGCISDSKRTVSLKILIAESDVEETLTFDQSTTVASVCQTIRRSFGPPAGNPSEFGLFVVDDDLKNRSWLNPDAKLKDCISRKEATVEYRKKQTVVHVQMLDETVKTVPVGENVTVGELLKIVCEGTKNHDEYSLACNLSKAELPRCRTPERDKSKASSKRWKSRDRMNGSQLTDVMWLNREKTLGQQGIQTESEVLLVRHKRHQPDLCHTDSLYVQDSRGVIKGSTSTQSDVIDNQAAATDAVLAEQYSDTQLSSSEESDPSELSELGEALEQADVLQNEFCKIIQTLATRKLIQFPNWTAKKCTAELRITAAILLVICASIAVVGKSVMWLNPEKTLGQQGIQTESEVLLVRHKRHQPDLCHTDSLYVQIRDAILTGKVGDVTEEEAVRFAGLQCQIQFGDSDKSKMKLTAEKWNIKMFGHIKLKKVVPRYYVGVCNIKQKIQQEHRRLAGKSESDCQSLYIDLASRLKNRVEFQQANLGLDDQLMTRDDDDINDMQSSSHSEAIVGKADVGSLALMRIGSTEKNRLSQLSGRIRPKARCLPATVKTASNDLPSETCTAEIYPQLTDDNVKLSIPSSSEGQTSTSQESEAEIKQPESLAQDDFNLDSREVIVESTQATQSDVSDNQATATDTLLAEQNSDKQLSSSQESDPSEQSRLDAALEQAEVLQNEFCNIQTRATRKLKQFPKGIAKKCTAKLRTTAKQLKLCVEELKTFNIQGKADDAGRTAQELIRTTRRLIHFVCGVVNGDQRYLGSELLLNGIKEKVCNVVSKSTALIATSKPIFDDPEKSSSRNRLAEVVDEAFTAMIPEICVEYLSHSRTVNQQVAKPVKTTGNKTHTACQIWFALCVILLIMLGTGANASPSCVATCANQPITLLCSRGKQGDIEWTYQRNAEERPDYVYANDMIWQKYVPRFSVNSSSGGSYGLTISNATVTDSGNYTCTEGGGYGNKHVTELLVLGTCDHVSVCAGKSSPGLDCLTPTTSDVVWKYYNETTGHSDYIFSRNETGEHYRARFKSDSSVSGLYKLIISDVRLSDAGFYTCSKVNSSENEHIFKVFVSDNDASCYVEKSDDSSESTRIIQICIGVGVSVPTAIVIIAIIIFLCRRKRYQNCCAIRNQCQRRKSDLESGSMEMDFLCPPGDCELDHSLRDWIELSSGLLHILLSHRVIDQEEFTRIQCGRTIYDQIDTLLDFMRNKPETKNQRFFEALQETNQEHVVNLIKFKGDIPSDCKDVRPIDDATRQHLQTHHATLINSMKPSKSFIKELLATRCIHEQQKQELKSCKTPADRNDLILTWLRRGSVRTYQDTINCLKKIGQSSVANILKTGLVARLEIADQPHVHRTCSMYSHQHCQDSA